MTHYESFVRNLKFPYILTCLEILCVIFEQFQKVSKPNLVLVMAGKFRSKLEQSTCCKLQSGNLIFI